MTMFLAGFAVGVWTLLAIMAFMVRKEIRAEVKAGVLAWRLEPDENLRPWFRTLRRWLRQTPPCRHCGGDRKIRCDDPECYQCGMDCYCAHAEECLWCARRT